jgi:RNA ligase
MFYIPTKKECDYIVENSKQFFRKDLEFLNKHISIYHYKQGNYEEFEKFKAYELRSLTFVEKNRFLGIHKFFELNQAPGWMYDDIKDKKILKITEKIDGTFIQPVLIDGEIYFKTKLNFDSFQAKRCNEILKKNKKLKEYISKKLSVGKIPLFEYFSPKTQVVMDYKEEKLFLTQVRDLKTGEYDLEFEKEAKEYGIETPRTFNYSFEELLNLAKTKDDIEGWVVIFEDMQFVKIKTENYLKKHKLIAKIEPHNIIYAILNNKADEYKSILNKESEKYQYFTEIENKFLKKYNLLKKDLKKAMKLTKKEFKQKFANHPYYELLATCRKKGENFFDEWIKQHTARLKGAKKFLDL